MAEHLTVAQVVVGSRPIIRPMDSLVESIFFTFIYRNNSAPLVAWVI